MSPFSSFPRRPESSQTNIPRSGQTRNVVVSLREYSFNQLDSGLRRNDGIYGAGAK